MHVLTVILCVITAHLINFRAPCPFTDPATQDSASLASSMQVSETDLMMADTKQNR